LRNDTETRRQDDPNSVHAQEGATLVLDNLNALSNFSFQKSHERCSYFYWIFWL